MTPSHLVAQPLHEGAAHHHRALERVDRGLAAELVRHGGEQPARRGRGFTARVEHDEAARAVSALGVARCEARLEGGRGERTAPCAQGCTTRRKNSLHTRTTVLRKSFKNKHKIIKRAWERTRWPDLKIRRSRAARVSGVCTCPKSAACWSPKMPAMGTPASTVPSPPVQ